jgi:septum formation protein
MDWVVGADTIVSLGRTIIGKPSDRDDAERILRMLSGTRHRAITGLCVVLPQQRLSLVDHVVTTLEMKRLSDKDLADYLDTNLWEGKAGAYGIQDGRDPFVIAFEGSFSNVVGLPMERLSEILALVRQMTETPDR